VYLDKPIVLREPGRPNRRRGGGSSRGSAILVIAALAATNYFLFFQDKGASTTPPIEKRLQQPAASPDSSPIGDPRLSPGTPGNVPRLDAPLRGDDDGLRDDFGDPVSRKIAGRLKRGQTVIKALAEQGIDNRTAMPLIRAMGNVFDFRQSKVGNKFFAWVDDEGQVTKFEYHANKLDVFQVELMRDGAYAASRKSVQTRIERAAIGCAIRSSLYSSIKRCGEGNGLAGIFIDLFAWDVDFFQDPRKGDELRVIVEKVHVDGKFLKYGRVLAAEYRGKFGTHQLLHYTDPDGTRGYYNPQGRAARKDFLKSPLKYTMVSAGSQSNVRGNLHKAGPVIYTAKGGTPVWAVAAGRVVFAGKAKSLGLTVTIRHEDGVTSTYGHLKKLGRGVRVGATVSQKTVIGEVGRTGSARQPQLMFSLRRNGKLLNPLRMTTHEGAPVPAKHRRHFKGEVKKLLDKLESTPVIGIHERS